MHFSTTLRRAQLDPTAIAIAILGTAVAASLFYTPLPLIVLIGIPACIYFATRPYQLLLVMVFLIPFNFIAKVGPFPVAAELLKVAVWLPFLLTRKQRPIFMASKFNKYFALLAGIIVLSLLRARDFPYTLKECVRFGSNLGLVYLCLNLVDSREKLLQIFRVLTVSTFLVACYGFYQWMIQDFGPLFWIVNPRLDTRLAHYRDYFWEWRHRIVSVLTSEMELGHYFNLCLPIGVTLWVTEGRKRLGSKWLLMTLCMLAGLVLTFTFGAWLALAATFGMFVLRFGGPLRRKIAIPGMLVLLLAAILVVYSPLRPLIEAKATGSDMGSFAWDAMSRLYGWKLALETWWSHPWLGVGIGNFASVSAGYDYVLGPQSQGGSPHETHLYLLADIGLVGWLSVIAIILASIRRDLALVRSQSEMALFGVALAFALVANMVGWFADDSGFLGPHAGYLLWLLVGLSEVTVNLSDRTTELASA